MATLVDDDKAAIRRLVDGRALTVGPAFVHLVNIHVGVVAALCHVRPVAISARQAADLRRILINLSTIPVAGVLVDRCVVAGIDRQFSYSRLNRAQQLILRGAHFVATNRDATFPLENGVAPGAGSIVAAIATASGQKPVVAGKPEPLGLQLILQEHNLRPEQAAMVGDRLDTDIACAHRAGIAALYVATGITTLQEAQNAEGELRPHACFADVGELVNQILSHR